MNIGNSTKWSLFSDPVTYTKIIIIGFCMSCIKEEVLNEASVDLIDSFSIISSSDTFKVSRHCPQLQTVSHVHNYTN